VKVEFEPGWRRRRGWRVGLASAAGGRSRVGAENSVTAFDLPLRAESRAGAVTNLNTFKERALIC
jgi:hypothetical protein